MVTIRDQSLDTVNHRLHDVQGAMLEILLELDPGVAGPCGLMIRRSPDGEEETLLAYDPTTARVYADRERSSLDRDAERSVVGGAVDLRGENLQLHVYLDHSMVEAYVNGIKSLTTRVYPIREDSLGLRVWGMGVSTIKSLDVWRLGPAYAMAH